jgi:VWFA-related protein
MKTRLPALALGLLATTTAASSAPPDPAATEQPVFRTGAAVVVLDVLVRDKNGRPVRDVTAGEVEVFEDGVEQTLEGFRWVETAAPVVEEPGAPSPAGPDPARQLTLVSLVFDQLGPDGRRLAAKAANAFLERGLRANTWAAVFQVDHRLALVQPYTNDAARLKDAVALATSGTYKGVIEEQAAMEQAQKDAELAAAAVPEATEGQGPPASGGAFAARVQAQAIANMLRLSNALQRQQLGTTSLYPLLALMRGHETLAGRKTLLYLSEGLHVPPNLEAVFRSTVSAANRANVSVYAVDVRGLDTERAMRASAEALDQARRVSQRTMESRGAGAVSKDEIYLADTAEGALRLNLEGTLGDLSASTGGFLISNTNDFRQGAERLAADLSGHYELTYQPSVVAYDGRFRKIEVKVARRGVAVQSRSGYFALPPGDSPALFPYEVPLLAALGRPEPVRGLEIRAAALHFEDGPAREHRLLVETPVGDLEMIEDKAKKTYRMHLSLLALVKDEHGTVVERFSEDYPFEGPLDKAEGLKLGNVVLKRRFTVPPGTYTLEVAGEDRELGRIGTMRHALHVSAPCAGPRMSSVTLIRRVEPAPARADGSSDPLEIGGMRIVPNLDLPISVAANQKLSLFFVAYPKDGENPRMSLEFWRGPKPLAKAEPELPAPDADGRIRYIGTFPIERFEPGGYEVRVALVGAAGRCQEKAAFTLVP